MLVVAAGYELVVLVDTLPVCESVPGEAVEQKGELKAVSSVNKGRVGGLLHKKHTTPSTSYRRNPLMETGTVEYNPHVRVHTCKQ